jgi:serine/threonine-protein kinase
MGTVFEALREGLGNLVAIKILHPNQLHKKDAVQRFHHEARAAARIGHPNICEVYDLGTLDDGSPYLVMERLVGETLADRIAVEAGLPIDDVVDILVQVLSGLVAAHEKGIVHRDIKPENVFLTQRVGCPPIVKLLDFGVSKMLTPLEGAKEEDLDLTRTGMVMGTPYYMSPEQARGDRDLDVRVDLYACGVIFYEALTGRRPFTAPNYNALLLQILTSKPRPARELRPALPDEFDAVISKAMARNRENRYRTASAFQLELQALRNRRRQVPGGEVPEGRPRRAPVPRPAPETTPSSIEIPIVVAGETPGSGESVPVEPGHRGLSASSTSEPRDTIVTGWSGRGSDPESVTEIPLGTTSAKRRGGRRSPSSADDTLRVDDVPVGCEGDPAAPIARSRSSKLPRG